MTLTLTIKPKTAKAAKKVVVEMDADKLERMAAFFGMLNPGFIESVERAERDFRAGRVKKMRSLQTLVR